MTPTGPAVSAPLWEELFMSTGTAVLADPHVVTCTLAPRFEAVRTAREFARSTLHGWGLGDLFDDVSLVASELVTNALRHALGARRDECSPATAGHPPRRPGTLQGSDEFLPIRISLVHREAQVVCAVSDPSSTGPVAREPDFVAESGRGLHLVDSFSRSWGWHPLAGAGKVVWAMFEAGPGPVEAPAGRHRRSA
ncbi:regulatory protein [Saccharothrix sp. ST-888]|nr:regulatory protein [Saccharothrix sp. ST-888]